MCLSVGSWDFDEILLHVVGWKRERTHVGVALWLLFESSYQACFFGLHMLFA